MTSAMDSAPSVNTNCSDDQKACGYSCLSNGKRHLLVGDIPEAVSTLAMASELLAKQFGETNIECAEAYFYYGKALLEMSRLESGVLGNALEGVPEGGDLADDSQVESPEKMTDEEKKVVAGKVKEALDFNYQTCEVERERAEAAEMDEEDEESQGDEPMEDDNSTKSTPMEEATPPSSSNDAATEKEDDEEPSNLQHAWEMLELAKVLYTKGTETVTDDKKVEFVKKICDIFLHLGEISLENENFQQAVEDLTCCLAKRKEVLPSDSRSIAETHYQLGIALVYSEKYDDAESSMNSAVEVLSVRLENLKKMESSEFLEKEIVDLQELVKEIRDKVSDFKEMKTSAPKKLKEAFSENPISDKPASSIAIKRKESSDAATAAAM